MASKKSKGNSVCPVCFESPPVVKIVGTCKHAFCTECLSSHLESMIPGSEVFPCPTCRVACPLPGNGVDGLVDYTDVSDFVEVECASPEEASYKRNRQDSKITDEAVADIDKEYVECQTCRLGKATAVPADNLCEDCGNIHLCNDCILIHGKNKFTQDHVVVPLKSVEKKKVANCKKHNLSMKNYCCTCSEPICTFCIFFNHGDHDIKNIGGIFHTVVIKIKSTLKDQERKTKDLKTLEKELKVLKSIGLDKKESLMRTIEDHAEKCMDQILKQKEALKVKVENEFSVVMDVSACLETIPDLVDRLEESVTKANGLLETDLHPADLENMLSIQVELDASGQLADQIDGEGYWESYQKLCENDPYFVQNALDFIGTLEVKQPTDLKVLNRTKFRLGELLFEHELDVDDKAKFIPCLVNLGKEFYAVAHPTKDGKPSDAIGIYKFPGTLKQILRENVYPVYDLAATPDGKLAVLSDGVVPGTSCCIRIFDPETGYVRSTEDMNLRGPLSFDVNILHQYVILSNDGETRITVCREDGSVLLTHLVDTDSHGILDFSRITCGAMSVFIMGEHGIAAYKLKLKQMDLITTSKNIFTEISTLKDISALCCGEVGVCYYQSSRSEACCGRFALVHNNDFFDFFGRQELFKPPHGADIESRLSLGNSNNYIVISQGHTVRVYTAKIYYKH